MSLGKDHREEERFSIKGGSISTGDISSWRIPVGQKEAEARRLETEGLVAQAAKADSVRLADRDAVRGRSLVYLVLLIAVVAVIVLATVLL